MTPEQVYDNLNMPVRFKIPAISNYYSSSTYILMACVTRKSPAGKIYHRAEIKDYRTNSVMYVDLADVEPAE